MALACGSATGGNADAGGSPASGRVPQWHGGRRGWRRSGRRWRRRGGSDILPPGKCVPGVPVTTQIPLLLNRQYANVVRDLLGVTAVGTTPWQDLLIGDFTGAMTAPAWEVYKDVGQRLRPGDGWREQVQVHQLCPERCRLL